MSVDPNSIIKYVHIVQCDILQRFRKSLLINIEFVFYVAYPEISLPFFLQCCGLVSIIIHGVNYLEPVGFHPFYISPQIMAGNKGGKQDKQITIE